MFLREGTRTPLSSSRLGSLIPEPAGSAQNHTWADRSLRCQVLLPPPAGEARGAPSGRHRPCRSQAPGGGRAASLRRISAEPRSWHQAAAAVGCGSSAPDPSAQARGRCARVVCIPLQRLLFAKIVRWPPDLTGAHGARRPSPFREGTGSSHWFPSRGTVSRADRVPMLPQMSQHAQHAHLHTYAHTAHAHTLIHTRPITHIVTRMRGHTREVIP